MTTYFITMCAHMQRNLFQRDEVAELLVATLIKYRNAGEYELHEYVVMPNHIHVLISLNHQNLGRVVQFIKGGFSHSLREHGIVCRAVWEQRYYDRRVRDEDEFAECSHYIRQNPVRKGLVERAEEYPYSSAHVPGLTPLEMKEGRVDANLKVRSTNPCAVDACLRARSTVQRVALDANLKVRSTDTLGTALKDAFIQSCETVDAGSEPRSTSESDKKCIATS